MLKGRPASGDDDLLAVALKYLAAFVARRSSGCLGLVGNMFVQIDLDIEYRDMKVACV